MKIFICKKIFKDQKIWKTNENLAIFSSLEKARNFCLFFPGCSMDDPEIFDVVIEEKILDQNLWEKKQIEAEQCIHYSYVKTSME